MKYLYTVFHARDGYAWEENAPESFTEITSLLSQCENISHQYYIFHRGNVLRIQKAENPKIKERLCYVYTVEDFRNEDGVFISDTKNKAWHQVIENFLTGATPFHQVIFTPEQTAGLLQSFAKHMPEQLMAGLIIDEDRNQNYRFFNTSQERIICDTESYKFLRKLPVFREENQIFRALSFHRGAPAVSMLEFIALLSVEMPENLTEFRKAYDKCFDRSLIQKSVEYLFIAVEEAFIQEAVSKLDSRIVFGLGIQPEFVKNITAWYLSSYGVHDVEELRLFLHLFACYGISSELLLPMLELWQSEGEQLKELPFFLKESEVLTYSEFVKAVKKNEGKAFITEDLSYETIDKIYGYIQEKEIPLPILENLFHDNKKDKILFHLLQFIAWKENPEKKPKNPERNFIPACLYWGNLVTEEELKNYYGSEETVLDMKKEAYEIRMPERILNMPEFSRNQLLADKLTEKYRLNALFQKGKLGKTEKTVLAVAGIGLLIILLSCIWLVMVML